MSANKKNKSSVPSSTAAEQSNPNNEENSRKKLRTNPSPKNPAESKSTDSLSSTLSLAKNSFKAFAAKFSVAAEGILHKSMPVKILELNNIYLNFPTFEQSVEYKGVTDGVKEPIGSNPSINQISPIVRQEVHILLEYMATLKLNIQLSIPNVDEGNNFGVEIQEEAIAEIARIEDIGYSMLEKFLTYAGNRSRLVSKIVKYPNIEDYWLSVRELDAQQHTELSLNVADMRNAYTMINDLLLKNEERLADPRLEKHKHFSNMM
jgi:proteasome activator subunit 2 (PA28 beta)